MDGRSSIFAAASVAVALLVPGAPAAADPAADSGSWARGSARAQAADAPATECDRLAGHPSDARKVAPGVQFDLIDFRAAIAACGEALKLHPGSARLQYQLGRALMRGQRRDEALPHLLQAAEQSYVIAFATIGNIYATELGNPAEGLKWLRRGVDQGDEASRLILGEMYIDGRGVERNFAEGLRLLQPLADKDNPIAVYKVGFAYVTGHGAVARDYGKAQQWLQRAAMLGIARAQNDLAYMTENGLGTPKDARRAASLYRASAEQGWGKAQANMGRLYENGIGVERDLKEALYWYRLAADSSQEIDRVTARERIEGLRKRVEPGQLAEIDGRVNKWRKMAPAESIALLAKAPAPEAPRQGGPEAPKPATIASADPGYTPPTRKPEPGVDRSYMPPGSVEIEPAKGRYIAKSGNIRSAPDTGAALAGKLSDGQEVNVTGKVAGSPWMVIAQDGKQAFVHSSLLRDPATVQVAAAPAPAAVVAKLDPPAAASSVQPVAITPTSTGALDYGNYHALVIGNARYRHIGQLKSPQADSHAVAKLLQREFGFEVTLINDATRADIIGALAKLRATLKWNDNLLIYYAGHGVVDEATERGYWLPVDAEEKVPTNWVSNADISDMVRAIEAKHVMVVADACYSGTLMRDTTARIDTARDRQVWLRRITSKRARTVLASGGIEPVLDSGGGEHSVFAKAFLAALGDSGDIIDAVTLFDKLRRPVVLNSDQTPRYADIRNAGHDGGEFVFVRKKPGGN